MATYAVTEQARGDCGGKALRAFLVTSDGATTTVLASELDLHYIDTALVTGVSMSDDAVPTLCIGAGTYILFGGLFADGDQANLWVWGY